MKIGYLSSEYPAISHTFIRREVAALRRRGLEVQTFSIRQPKVSDWMGDEDVAERRDTHYVLPPQLVRLLQDHVSGLARRPGRYLATLRHAASHRPPGLRASLNALYYFAESIALARELERRGVTHLHNHFANPAAIVGFLASRYLELPWSFTVHGISEFDYPAGLLLREKIEAARFVACVSHFGRAQAQRLVDPSHWSKLFINRCGIDTTRLPTPQGRSAGDRPRLLAVGRLSPEKAFTGLVEAFARARAQGVTARLDIIGDGPERERVQNAIDVHGLGEHCALLGQQSEAVVLQNLTTADAFIMSSLMEGLPVVLMEALALEVPVIAPRVAGIPELVEEGQTGLLFSPGNWPELGECLVRIMSDAELRRRLGRAGRARVLAEFDVERAVEPILAMLLAEHGVAASAIAEASASATAEAATGSGQRGGERPSERGIAPRA